MRNCLLRAFTEWQSEVRVGFLSIVVWTDGIHPQDNFLSMFILRCYSGFSKTAHFMINVNRLGHERKVYTEVREIKDAPKCLYNVAGNGEGEEEDKAKKRTEREKR